MLPRADSLELGYVHYMLSRFKIIWKCSSRPGHSASNCTRRARALGGQGRVRPSCAPSLSGLVGLKPVEGPERVVPLSAGTAPASRRHGAVCGDGRLGSMPMSRGPPLAVPPLRLISRDRFLAIFPLQYHHRLQPRQQRPVQGGWTR